MKNGSSFGRVAMERPRSRLLLRNYAAPTGDSPNRDATGGTPIFPSKDAALEEAPEKDRKASSLLHFQAPGVEAEIVEVSMTEPDKFIVRTRGQSPLKKGDVIVVDIRS